MYRIRKSDLDSSVPEEYNIFENKQTNINKNDTTKTQTIEEMTTCWLTCGDPQLLASSAEASDDLSPAKVRQALHAELPGNSSSVGGRKARNDLERYSEVRLPDHQVYFT